MAKMVEMDMIGFSAVFNSCSRIGMPISLLGTRHWTLSPKPRIKSWKYCLKLQVSIFNCKSKTDFCFHFKKWLKIQNFLKMWEKSLEVSWLVNKPYGKQIFKKSWKHRVRSATRNSSYKCPKLFKAFIPFGYFECSDTKLQFSDC